MHLWLVEYDYGYDSTISIVRASDEEAACRMVCPNYDDRYCPTTRPTVKWLQPDGGEATLWSRAESTEPPWGDGL